MHGEVGPMIIDDVRRSVVDDDEIKRIIGVRGLRHNRLHSLRCRTTFERIKTQLPTRAAVWISCRERLPIQDADRYSMLIHAQPGAAGEQILPAVDPGGGPQFRGTGRGTNQYLVAIGGKHEGVVGKGAKEQNERTHDGGQVYEEASRQARARVLRCLSATPVLG